LTDSDPTEGLALMAKILKKIVRTVKTSRKTALRSKNLAKLPLSLDATWHLKAHSITASGDLEL
jgi:hypothetical protein